MTALPPLIERELRLASRRPFTYWLRCGAAAIAILIAVGFAVMGKSPPALIGSVVFNAVTLLGFSFCILAGVYYTADSLSQERRAGTLGLLFLTDLKGRDIIFAKLASTSLNALYQVLAILPVIGLPVLLGGISAGQFSRGIFLLLNTLFFSLSVGLLVSVLGREEKPVLVTTFAVLFCFTFALPAAWKLASFLVSSRWLEIIFLLPSPAYAYWTSIVGHGDFWLSMLVMLGFSLSFLATASFLLPRLFREDLHFSSQKLLGPWFRPRRVANDKQRQESRARLMRINPCLWLASRGALHKSYTWMFVILTICFGAWTFAGGYAVPAGLPVLFGLHLLLKWFLAAEACRWVHQERGTGALELVVVTPMGIQNIVAAQIYTSLTRFSLHVIILIAVQILWIVLGSSLDVELVFLGGFVFLGADFLAITWVGLATGLLRSRYPVAVFETLGRVMLPGWIPFLLVVGTGRTEEGLAICCIVTLANDVWLIAWAAAKLRKAFLPTASATVGSNRKPEEITKQRWDLMPTGTLVSTPGLRK